MKSLQANGTALINLDVALERLGYDRALYADAVARFMGDGPSMLTEFRHHLEADANAQAADVIHRMKGGAATVGHESLAALAGEIEEQLRNIGRLERATDLAKMKVLFDEGAVHLASIVAGFDLAVTVLAAPEPEDSPERKPLILIVDDQPGTVAVLAGILRADYRICVAGDGAEALRICADRRPDLMLLDVNMPGMDGFEACQRAKTDPLLADVPIVIITASNTPTEEARAFEAGAADFIAKPFDARIVRARVRNQIDLRTKSETLQALAATDGLTGIANRRRFDEALDQEWRRAEREDTPLSLLLIDVDYFKAYNDRYGHQAGDACLQAIARVLEQFCRRPGDLAARYGGEEMAIVLPAASGDFVGKTAEAVRAAIEALAIPHAGIGTVGSPDAGCVTVSIGAATVKPRHSIGSPQDLIMTADMRLYEAKRAGRNRVMASPS